VVPTHERLHKSINHESSVCLGFVRFGKVKDVEKLLKALNNVWFSDWRVVAKVASFDRFGNSRGVHRERGEGEKLKEGVKNTEGEKSKVGKCNALVII